MKPMLACSKIPKLSTLRYPKIASPKLDGIRCLIVDGVCMSRHMKPLPNLHIQRMLGSELNGCDGELMLRVGDFNSVQSGIMSIHGEPNFEYRVFDYWDHKGGFLDRFDKAMEVVEAAKNPDVSTVGQYTCASPEEVTHYWDHWVDEGYEGAILRDPRSEYKHGRSTLKQEWMLKLKTFNDDEGQVVGFEELMHNGNPAEIGELGQTTRSHSQDGKYGGDTLGALVVAWKGHIIKIGTGIGMDQALRKKIWMNRGDYLNRKVTFKYQELSKYGVPRFPTWKGFRDE